MTMTDAVRTISAKSLGRNDAQAGIRTRTGLLPRDFKGDGHEIALDACPRLRLSV